MVLPIQYNLREPEKLADAVAAHLLIASLYHFPHPYHHLRVASLGSCGLAPALTGFFYYYKHFSSYRIILICRLFYVQWLAKKAKRVTTHVRFLTCLFKQCRRRNQTQARIQL